MKTFNLYVADAKHSDRDIFVLAGLLVTPDVAADIKKRTQNLNLKEKSTITDKLLPLILDVDCTLFAGVVDNEEVRRKYTTPYSPAANGYECLLQRVHMQMCQRNGCVNVTIGKLSGTTDQGTDYNTIVRDKHRTLRTTGSTMQPKIVLHSLKENLVFADRHSNPTIQLASVVAEIVHNQVVAAGFHWDVDDDKVDVGEDFERIREKFCRNQYGLIAGWGVVIFPHQKEVTPPDEQLIAVNE